MLGIGALFSILFHMGTAERRPGAGGEAEGEAGRGRKRMDEEDEEEAERRPLLPRPPSSLLQWKCWLQQPSFYQVGTSRQVSLLL